VFLIYGSKITAASRGFPATARLSCLDMGVGQTDDDRQQTTEKRLHCLRCPTCYYRRTTY